MRKKAAALLKCHATAEKKGLAVDDATFTCCLAEAKLKFDGGALPADGCFARLEGKFGTECPTAGDRDAIEAVVDAFVLDIVTSVDPGFPLPTPTP